MLAKTTTPILKTEMHLTVNNCTAFLHLKDDPRLLYWPPVLVSSLLLLSGGLGQKLFSS